MSPLAMVALGWLLVAWVAVVAIGRAAARGDRLLRDALNREQRR